MFEPYLKKQYNGKKVFLTGHTGFKGAWLLQWLQILGAQVKGYALPPEGEENLYNIIQGSTICDSVLEDIRKKKVLEREICEFEPDYIFHLAAQPLVRLSYDIPLDTFEVNALGTAYILDAVRKLKGPCVVILITTDKVYENKEWIYPYRENDRLGGYDPYSASKACAELVINSYKQSYFNSANYSSHQKSVVSVRAGNVIGGGDWSKDRIIPDIIKALQNNKPVEVRNPHAIRPWQHVLEPLSGYLLIGARLIESPLEFEGAWNFGPYADDNKTVEELVQLAIKKWGSGTYIKPDLGKQLHEAGLLKLDISKATGMLNWMPKMNAEESVNLTVSWYSKYFQGENIKQFTIEQINSYIKR